MCCHLNKCMCFTFAKRKLHKQYYYRIPGAYLLDIKWNGKPLKCCPFKIDVKKPVYPEKVGVTGEHLRGAVIGRDIDLRIDPREAGHGKLYAGSMYSKTSETCTTNANTILTHFCFFSE